MRFRSGTISRMGSRPSTDTRPASGERRPSMHSIVVVLPAPFGPDQAEDLALEHLERDLVHGVQGAVRLREAGDLDDGGSCHGMDESYPVWRSCGR